MRSKELANLDCLRAFAVIAVLIDHLAMMLASGHGTPASEFLVKLGHLGVLAFFVHTSLVLMFSMERLPAQGLALRFYVRRAFRIYPLSILCILCVLVFRIPAVPLVGEVFRFPSPAVLLGNLFLVQNLVGRESILGPLWSLPFEIEMYIVLPLLFRIAVQDKALRYLGALAAGACGAGWLVFTWTGHTQILAYVPCFLAGVIAFSLRSRLRPFVAAAAWPWFVAVWMAVSSWALLSSALTQLVVSWAACLLLGFTIYCVHDSVNTVWNRVTNITAKYSYGIYLCHVPIMWIVFRVWNVSNDLLATMLSLALTLAAAAVAYHLVENPMIQLARRLTRVRAEEVSSALSGVSGIS